MLLLSKECDQPATMTNNVKEGLCAALYMLCAGCCVQALFRVLRADANLLPSQVDVGASPVSAIFAFGDSIVDSGNTNYLASIAKSNYWPYGCDFRQGPSGRFCNGRTVIDILGERLAIPYLPAFADPAAIGLRIIRGVNYASAGAGILDVTSRHWALYNVGLRKFFIVGLAPIGCTPNQKAARQAPEGRCADYVNQIIGTFNEGLRSLVTQLNANHPAAIFVYFNAYGAMGDVLNNPAAYGFSVVDRACCGLGEVTCLPNAIPCPNRNQYLFWDAYHTTEAANAILAQRAFAGPPSDCYPINFQQLALI
uniref:GDSL esterase/lipase n=1 Tax=Chenopodium quinoa TaxID=63459 RepID=A0A803N0R9_CHEQI